MFDTIIKGGAVVNGTGAAAKTADVAIQDGRIAEIGRISALARETINADGALVTPGFLDVHTHYDGQFLWDDRMDPSFSHGVTTAIGGNCGVGFAPVGEHRKELIELMEGVEDIPAIVIDEGLDWSWRSFPEYLAKLDERRYAMDVASHITHAPLRVFVMGERALRHEAATPEDLDAMGKLVREAMDSGAMGFSSGRIVEHLSSKGAQVPGTFADDTELLAMARAMGGAGHGVFQIIPRGAIGARGIEGDVREARVEEHKRIEAIARAAGRPLTYTALEFRDDTDDIHFMAGESRKATQAGLNIRPQVSARGTGVLFTLDGYHAFVRRPSYREIAHLPLVARVEAMRNPARRAAILAEADVREPGADANVEMMLNGLLPLLPNTVVLRSPLDYEPGPEQRVSVLAEAAGKTPEEFIYDYYTQGDGTNFNVLFALNYVQGSLDHIHKLLSDGNVVSGLGDGGAHMKIICDASQPTFQLAFWTRDRTRGARLPIELMVRKLSAEPAELYGLRDRGTLEVGKRADLNVIDYPNLKMRNPRITHDLPSGGGRMLQASEGYLATLVAGIATRRNDTDTGARPGRLVRGRAA